MTKINLTELEKLAGEVKVPTWYLDCGVSTRSAWALSHGSWPVFRLDGPGNIDLDAKKGGVEEALVFVEAADPTTILTLCKALREAVKELEHIEKTTGHASPCKPKEVCREGCDTARDAAKALTAIRAAVEI